MATNHSIRVWMIENFFNFLKYVKIVLNLSSSYRIGSGAILIGF